MNILLSPEQREKLATLLDLYRAEQRSRSGYWNEDFFLALEAASFDLRGPTPTKNSA